MFDTPGRASFGDVRPILFRRVDRLFLKVNLNCFRASQIVDNAQSTPRRSRNSASVASGCASTIDDLADALVFLMARYSREGQINVGTGKEVSIAGLAERIAETVGYRGRFVYDSGKPDGTPRKLTDVSRLNALGWTARTDLAAGLALTYRWFLDHVAGGSEDRRAG